MASPAARAEAIVSLRDVGVRVSSAAAIPASATEATSGRSARVSELRSASVMVR